MKICPICNTGKEERAFYKGYGPCIKCHLETLPPKDKKPINAENTISSFLLMETSSDGKDGFATGEDYSITYEKGLLIVKYLKKKKPDGSSYIKWFSVHNTREIIK